MTNSCERCSNDVLQHGADPSVRFLDELGIPGDCPVLHCAENGYHECLSLLLTHATLDLHAVTSDKKTFLGQAMAVYTAGGENV